VTSRAAVLGSPIEHSLSPALHRAAYSVLGLDWDYRAIECTVEDFPTFFAGMDHTWRGLSLTMPLKEVVLEVVSDASDLARTLHSANTVYRCTPADPWRATNTDVFGIEQALREAGMPDVHTAHVLGAGATARSAVAALADLGAREVVVHARRRQAAEGVAALAAEFDLAASSADLTAVPIYGELLISTLPADVAAPWSGVQAPATTALLDVSYHPWPTPLARAWRLERPDAVVASGRDMLVWQALAQVELMTGADIDAGAVLRAMRNAVA
jgi:shikimate dehydrogenase